MHPGKKGGSFAPLDPPGSATVTKESQLSFSKLTLGGVKSNTCLFDSLKHCFESLIVFLHVAPKDQDVVHEAKNTCETIENLCHSLLEMLRGTCNSKWHIPKAVASEWCYKCC